MGDNRGTGPDAWWLLAGPAAGVVVGTVVGAVSGWLATPTEGVGPLVGNSDGAAVLGGLMGMALGTFTGLLAGVVLMFMLRRGTTRCDGLTARLLAAGVAAACCPAVLLVLADIGRVETEQLGLTLTTVAALAAGTFAWLAGRTPART